MKNNSSLNFLSENLEKFRSTERLSCASRGMDTFSLVQLHELYSVGSSQLAELKYAFLSRKGRKTKNHSAQTSFHRQSSSAGS